MRRNYLSCLAAPRDAFQTISTLKEKCKEKTLLNPEAVKDHPPSSDNSQKSHLIPNGISKLFFLAHRLQEPSKIFIQKTGCAISRVAPQNRQLLHFCLKSADSMSDGGALLAKWRLFVLLMVPPDIPARPGGLFAAAVV